MKKQTKIWLGLGLLLLAVVVIYIWQSPKAGDPEKEKKDSATKSISEILQKVDVSDSRQLYALDSIPVMPIQQNDTSGTDEETKDSILFARKFQLAANALSKAENEKNYSKIVSYVPPGLINKYGSAAALAERLKSKDANSTAPKYEKVISGPVKKLAPDLDDKNEAGYWYCLMPVRSYFKKPDGSLQIDMRWLGGEIDVDGKHIYFLDITGKSREKILQVMPGLTVVLDKD